MAAQDLPFYELHTTCVDKNTTRTEARPTPSFKMRHRVKQRYAANHCKFSVFISPASSRLQITHTITLTPWSQRAQPRLWCRHWQKSPAAIPSQQTRAGKQQEGGAELSAPPNLSTTWWLSSARFRPGCCLPLPKGENMGKEESKEERVWSPCPQLYQLHFARGSINRIYAEDASVLNDVT